MGKFFDFIAGGYVIGKTIDELKKDNPANRETIKIDTQTIRDSDYKKKAQRETEFLNSLCADVFVEDENNDIYSECLDTLLYIKYNDLDSYEFERLGEIISLLYSRIVDVQEEPNNLEYRFILLETIMCAYHSISDALIKANIYNLAHMQARYIEKNIRRVGVTNKVKYHMAKLYDAEIYILEGRYAAGLQRYFEFLNWDDLLYDIYRVSYDSKDLTNLYYAVLGNIISIYRLFDYTEKANEIKEIFSEAIESAINEYKDLRRRYMDAGREGYVEFYDYLIASFNCTSLPVAEDHFSFLDIEEPRRNPKKTIPFFSLSYIYAWKSEAHEFPSKCRIDEYLVDVGDPVVWNMDFDLTDCDITCYKCKKNLYKMNHGEILVNENGEIDTVPSIDYGIPMVSSRHYSYQDNGKNIIPAEEERILIGKVPYSKEKSSEFEQDFINNYVIYKMYNYHCK